MNLEGERRLPAPIESAWAALNDPAALKACITGCESLDKTGDDEYTAVMAVRIGPVNAKFKGRLRLTNVNPPSSYTIEFDGQGGVAGFGKGAADVSLTPDGDHTVLRYQAKAQVGGKIAQIGSRLVDSAAEKVAGEFFGAFEKYLLDLASAGAPAQAAAPDESVNAPGSAPPGPAAQPLGPQPSGGVAWGWLIAGAVIVGAVLWWLAR